MEIIKEYLSKCNECFEPHIMYSCEYSWTQRFEQPHHSFFLSSFLMWKARAFYLKLTLTQCHDWMFKWKKSGKSFSYFSSAVTWQLALHLRASNCVETGALPEKIYVIFYSPIKIPKKNEGKISSHGWADIHKALNWKKNS